MREIGDIEYAENNNQSEFAYEYTNIHSGGICHTHLLTSPIHPMFF